jgi:hypothetical protein
MQSPLVAAATDSGILIREPHHLHLPRLPASRSSTVKLRLQKEQVKVMLIGKTPYNESLQVIHGGNEVEPNRCQASVFLQFTFGSPT